MVKARSPQYPAISLKEAVEKVAGIYEHDYQNQIPRQVIAEHMGYTSLNGKSLGVLAALSKFGLLEGRGDNSRVSDLAVRIIAHPSGSPERAEALRMASTNPELFNELDERFQGGKASDQAIRSYLLTQKFIPSAADAAIRSYRETKQFVNAESEGYAAHHETEVETQPVISTQQTRGLPSGVGSGQPVPIVLTGGAPFSLTLSGGRLQGTFSLANPADADEMIRAINAWKILLTPANQPFDTGKDEDAEPDGAAE